MKRMCCRWSLVISGIKIYFDSQQSRHWIHRIAVFTMSHLNHDVFFILLYSSHVLSKFTSSDFLLCFSSHDFSFSIPLQMWFSLVASRLFSSTPSLTPDVSLSLDCSSLNPFILFPVCCLVTSWLSFLVPGSSYN